MIECRLILYSNTMHLEQVYTGLYLLNKNGVVNLSIEVAKDEFGKKKQTNNLCVTKLFVNGIGVLIDTHDNFGLYLNDFFLEGVQYYFKRAYRLDGYSDSELQHKIKVLPFGLNYALYGGQFFWWQRYFLEPSTTKKIELFARNSKFFSKLLNLNTSAAYCNEKVIYQNPICDKKPLAILMTRVWSCDNKKLSEEVLYKRHHLNELRVNCIIELRKKYGEDFYGGLFMDEFSKKKYPELLISNNKLAAKKNYLKKLKSASVGVSVNGLFSSGWSIGEYTAMSKAIVIDEVKNILPYGFNKNQNYLSFTDAKQCVNCVDELMVNQELRLNMMQKNHEYYLNFLAPEKLMLNLIKTVLK